MLLTGDELLVVYESIDKLRQRITRANYEDDEPILNSLLDLLGISFEEKEIIGNWKIFLCAGTEASRDSIKKVISDYGFDGRVDMELDYSKITTIDFEKFKKSQTYKYIIFGQGPHSSKGKGKYGSVISRMESEPFNFPKVIVLKNSQDKPHLSITNLNRAFEKVLIDLD